MPHYPRHLTQKERIEATMDPYGMGQARQNSAVNRLKQRAKAKAIAEAKVLAEAKAKAANKFNSPSNAVQRTYSPSIFLMFRLQKLTVFGIALLEIDLNL